MTRNELHERLMIEQAGRAANEAIVRFWGVLAADDRALFRCECGEETCRTALWLPLGRYETVRQDPAHFVVLPGHVAPPDEIVEAGDGYVVIRQGLAA